MLYANTCLIIKIIIIIADSSADIAWCIDLATEAIRSMFIVWKSKDIEISKKMRLHNCSAGTVVECRVMDEKRIDEETVLVIDDLLHCRVCKIV